MNILNIKEEIITFPIQLKSLILCTSFFSDNFVQTIIILTPCGRSKNENVLSPKIILVNGHGDLVEKRRMDEDFKYQRRNCHVSNTAQISYIMYFAFFR